MFFQPQDAVLHEGSPLNASRSVALAPTIMRCFARFVGAPISSAQPTDHGPAQLACRPNRFADDNGPSPSRTRRATVHACS